MSERLTKEEREALRIANGLSSAEYVMGGHNQGVREKVRRLLDECDALERERDEALGALADEKAAHEATAFVVSEDHP